MFDLPEIEDTVATALAEDLGVGVDRLLDTSLAGPDLLAADVTTAATVDPDARFVGRIVAREACTVCGLPVAARVFEMLANAAVAFEAVEVYPLVAEGSEVTAGTPVAEIDGLASAILAAERTALDFLMVLSGIATETARWVEAAGGRFDICDTRKTVPGLRALSKYAVRVGGGTNHRAGLYDQVLVKDNHLRHAGGITAAVDRARAHAPGLLVEIEADHAEQAVEAVRAGADIVLLDNMDATSLAKAVAAARAAAAEVGRAVVLELSGGVRAERLGELSDSGIDRVSSSALTLAAPVDFGLDEA